MGSNKGVPQQVCTQVFVYGSLLSGLGNNRWLRDSQLVGESALAGFRMVSLGAFPGLVYGEDVQHLVQGEVYSVTSGVLLELDFLEGEGTFYTREVVQTEYGEAWVYVLPLDRYGGSSPVPSGNWKQHKADQHKADEVMEKDNAIN